LQCKLGQYASAGIASAATSAIHFSFMFGLLGPTAPCARPLPPLGARMGPRDRRLAGGAMARAAC
jgi:hypothetical protein